MGIRDRIRNRAEKQQQRLDAGFADKSGERQARGSSFGKLLMSSFLVALVAYIAWAQPYGIVLPGGWPLYVLGGGFLLGFQGIGLYTILVLYYRSTRAGWPTGTAPVRNLKAVTEEFWPSREYADENHCYLQVDEKTRYYYPYKAFEVNGSNWYVSFPGHDFVVIPWIEIPQEVFDWKTGEHVVKLINYSKWDWGPDLFTLNGDTTRAVTHDRIPTFMYEILKEIRGFRPDPSVGGTWKKDSASRVDFALWPKFDPWAWKALEWPGELKRLSKLEARETHSLQRMADAATSRANRAADVMGRGNAVPAQNQQGRAPPPYKEGEEV